MSEPEWETIEVQPGAFIGWGNHPGQHVTGKVLGYSPAGGTDFNNEACPLLAVELLEQAASFNKAGERTDFPAGELVNLTVGQIGLKTALQKAQPNLGDLVKITMTGTSVTKKGNATKNFDLKIARGAGQGAAPVQQQQPPSAMQQVFGAAAPPQRGFQPQPSAEPPF
jgi:hypothetical protein